jgi:hypothetical protein
MKFGHYIKIKTLTCPNFFLGHLKYLLPMFSSEFVVVAANTLTSLQFGHNINGNPLTTSIGAGSSTSVGGSAAATTAGGAACRGTLGALERRLRAVDDNACDMTTREGERESRD